MKELERRTMFCEDPFGANDAAMAEIVLDDNGEKIYYYGEWTNEGGELYTAAATESLFAINEGILACEEDPDELAQLREELTAAFPAERFAVCEREFRSAIRQLLTNEMKAHGVRKRI